MSLLHCHVRVDLGESVVNWYPSCLPTDKHDGDDHNSRYSEDSTGKAKRQSWSRPIFDGFLSDRLKKKKTHKKHE